MAMLRDPLLRAWGWLIGLSLCSTGVSLWHWPATLTPLAGALILTLGSIWSQDCSENLTKSPVGL